MQVIKTLAVVALGLSFQVGAILTIGNIGLATFDAHKRSECVKKGGTPVYEKVDVSGLYEDEVIVDRFFCQL
jgi:hypothetical protein